MARGNWVNPGGLCRTTMSRTAKPAIDPKMYRHFAVATLILTALIGFFADGENRDAAAEAVASTAQPAADTPKARPSQSLAFRDGRKSQSWGNDAGGGGDGGDDGGGNAGDGEYGPGNATSAVSRPPVPMSPAMQLTSMANLPDTAPPGMPKSVFDQLKREQKRIKSAGPQVITRQDMSRMIEQSRQRSGGEDLDVEQSD